MSETSSNPAMILLRVVGRALATIVVVVWALFDDLLFPLVRPLIRWLSSLSLFEALGAAIARLPPYAVLVLLAVPFVLIEPLKLVALYWIATGLFVRGVALLVISYLLSIFTLDRIYHAGHVPLMRIGWFARLMRWIVRLRDHAFAIAKSTAAWRWAAETTSAVRTWFRTVLQSAR